MAKEVSAPKGMSNPVAYKEPPPSISAYFNKGQTPDGFDEVDVGDQAILRVRGKVRRKSLDLNGGSIEIEWKRLELEPGNTKKMSLNDALGRLEKERTK
uniref:Uncharacterized protein n=1 Tax=viral metagenome TaxID=1070528 RepID=A0A6M3IIA7_9ZZZZ